MSCHAAADRSRGYAGVFRLVNGTKEYRLALRGVQRGAKYKVTLDNANQVFRATGCELAERGLPISLDAANTSELVMCGL